MPMPANGEDVAVPLNKIRQITAKRTAESKSTVPHFYVTVAVDLENVLALRGQYEAAGSPKPSINDFVIKACALALREMPVVNSSFHGDHVLQYGAVNVGMAVALDDGLTVAVVRNADRLPLLTLSALAKDLGERARVNQLTLDELTGSTFSISNMGMLGVENFSAIINQPNAGIVAIATAQKQVVVTGDDDFEIRTIMKMTGSFDHRVVDGSVGAQFMNVVKQFLENPVRMLS
jgi:pyruvate dehydrogenase E2 component (dihydrolipoamide acetyltransferase)